MAQNDRDILFSNEALVIGMLQAVSGASLVAALSQAETLLKYAGRLALVGFLTSMGVALLAAVLSAYWKHQYKLWDVKAQVSASNGEKDNAFAQSESSNTYLKWMRRAMFCAVMAILLGVTGLIVSLWVQFARGG